ncbi:hypothetical protein Vretimale_5827 [Volvox reticuliferus]|uniref:non-specific serine/threonine protein kinase n=1 Tax=Volvox reticuliferus TaxID=1737510 RepID=A0A8J4CCY4_9CHLO|nr:hypothetical protein Vretifemale_5873 [Volvox reticuliferus]GIM00993.1 hypothetical protein Vretimale_5827 [Volvox reticuliferus]
MPIPLPGCRVVIHCSTPEFMAPEVYDESYDERCDIYSFGMCLLELATLEYPYAECHSVPQIFKKVTLGVPPASLVRVNPDLREFISLCIAHNPDDRPSARELLKHPYLEAVRLTGSDSACILSSGASSGALASMSAGGTGSGWNTPSGTLHCAASVRDLREALHQQEALARHHHQLCQHQQQQFLHSSCPDVHAAAFGASAASATAEGVNVGGAVGAADDASAHDIVRSNSVTVAVLARKPYNFAAANISGQISPLGRSSTAQCANPTATEVTVTLASPPVISPVPPADSVPATGNSGGGTGPPVSGRSMRSIISSAGSACSDTDSDEEVLVPIELIKAGLLEEGFVDSDDGCFSSGPSQASSDPSAISLVDPGLVVSRKVQHSSRSYARIVAPQPKGRRRRRQEASRLQPRPQHEQQQEQKQQLEGARWQAVLSGGSDTCKTTVEGISIDTGHERKCAVGIAAAVAEVEEELESSDRTEEDEEQGGDYGDGEMGRPLDAVSQPSVDLDPWAQRWALQGSLEAAMGLGHSGSGSAIAKADAKAYTEAQAAPSLACSAASSASSTTKIMSNANGGRHSRQSSADGITFSPQVPPGASGASTPALRVSYSGDGSQPTPPTPPQQQVLLPLPEMAQSQPPGPAVPQPVPSLPLLPSAEPTSSVSVDLSATEHAVAASTSTPPLHLPMQGPAPSSAVLGMVRLPSFRNRFLLTMQAAKGVVTGSSAGGCPPVPYIRSTSARLSTGSVGGCTLRARDVSNLSYPSALAGHPVTGVPGYASLGGSTIYRRAPGDDSGLPGGPAGALPIASPEAAAAAVEAAVVMSCKDDGGMERLVPQTMPLPLRRLPEGRVENAASSNSCLSPSAVMASKSSGSRRSSSGSEVAVKESSSHTAAMAMVGRHSDLAEAGMKMRGREPSSAVDLCDNAAAAISRCGHIAGVSLDGQQNLPASAPLQLTVAYPEQHVAEVPMNVTVIKEVTRPIQGVIMRLKQLRRLMTDRAKAAKMRRG